MATNAFYCPHCHEVKKHLEISSREMAAAENESELYQLGVGLSELTGVASLVRSITGRRFWKCYGCEAVSCRTASGKIVRIT